MDLDKKAALDQIASEIASFRDLDIARNCIRSVPGEGDPNASIMFIGEAPGFNEDKLGRPFVGQAGKLLEKVLTDPLHLTRSEVFITNIVKFRPPENRDPTPEEILACKGWLDRQIQIVSPKIIVTLGRYSMGKFIPDASISRVHGQPRNYRFPEVTHPILIFPMYHPAAALRSGDMMAAFVADFQKLNAYLQAQKTDGKTGAPVEELAKKAQQSLF